MNTIKIVSVEEMRAAERAADAAGHTYADMMQEAGRVVAEAVLGRLEEGTVLVLVGPGDNGGDGLVAARHLAKAGFNVVAYLTRPRDDEHVRALKHTGALVATADDDQRWRVLDLQLGRANAVIDAVLGTGISLPVRGSEAKVLERARQKLFDRRAMIVALDCPSGLNCDTGDIADVAIPADLTVTLAAVKRGSLQFPGADYVGALEVGDIGPLEALAELPVEFATKGAVARLLPDRPRDAHKGTFGTVRIVGGSLRYPGAAGLAATGAYRVGAGLVELDVPHGVQPLVAPALPEAIWRDPESEPHPAACVLAGPGMGTDEAHIAPLLEDLGPDSSLVIDADGLRQLAAIPDWPDKLPANAVLTPHPGEMGVLTGLEVEHIQHNRIEIARQHAADWGCVVLLKGAHSVVAESSGAATVMPYATSALASAGTGDVLAGMITGFRAQGLEGYPAAVLGAYLHGSAGTLAEIMLGGPAPVTASDVAQAIPEAMAELADPRKIKSPV